jgi:hypothetical protein
MVDATRDLILSADDIELVKLSVPAWKDKEGNVIDVYIKQMSGKDAEEYIEATSPEHGGSKQRNAKVLVSSVCDKDGKRLFTNADIAALQDKNSRVITWLVEEILKINFKSSNEIETEAKN